MPARPSAKDGARLTNSPLGRRLPNNRGVHAAAVSDYLPAGTYEYTYVVRATTPGSFVTPPTKAEEIYSPEVFGRTSTTRVVIA